MYVVYLLLTVHYTQTQMSTLDNKTAAAPTVVLTNEYICILQCTRAKVPAFLWKTVSCDGENYFTDRDIYEGNWELN